jgi:hypothetical protein
VDQSKDKIRLISPSKVHVPWWIQGTAPELHHGFTTQGQQWQLGSSLSHLLGNSRTRGVCRLPPGASPHVGGSLMNGWMSRPAEAEVINRQAPRAKGGTNRARNRPGRPAWADRPRPVSARFGPVSLPDASQSIVDLLPYACGPLTLSSPRFGQSSLSCKLQHLLSRSLEFHGFFGPWALWSHVHDVSWLVSGFMIISWSAWWTYPESLPLSSSFLRKQQTPKSTCESEFDTSGGLVPLVRISNTCKCWR